MDSISVEKIKKILSYKSVETAIGEIYNDLIGLEGNSTILNFTGKTVKFDTEFTNKYHLVNREDHFGIKYFFNENRDLAYCSTLSPSFINGGIDTLNNTNSSMLNNIEFTLICGGIGVVVAVLGIYVDSVVPAFRRIKKVFTSRRKR